MFPPKEFNGFVTVLHTSSFRVGKIFQQQAIFFTKQSNKSPPAELPYLFAIGAAISLIAALNRHLIIYNGFASPRNNHYILRNAKSSEKGKMGGLKRPLVS